MRQFVRRLRPCVAIAALLAAAHAAHALTLVVATVNNGHMLQLQAMSKEFEQSHPDIRIRWVTLPEGELRRAVGSDVKTRGGQFNVVTLGMYEVAVWAQRGWLAPIRPAADYGVDDLLDNIREGLSFKGELYAAPFYGESSMLFYRQDLLARAGLSMPARPTWAEVEAMASRLHDPAKGVYGICLRGMPGWGENMTLVATMVNAHGGRWFDMQWKPMLQSPAWQEAVSLYVGLLRRFGPPDATQRGYNRNLALFSEGRCALWVDATVAAGYLTDVRQNPNAAHVGFAPAPRAMTDKGSHWLWAWALAIPASENIAHVDAARKFVSWATSRQYTQRVAATRGWGLVPPGVRKSTYADPSFKKAAPWATLELKAIQQANPRNATLEPSPYLGVQFAAIDQFAAIGDAVGKQVAEAVTGQISVEVALARGQALAQRNMAVGDLPVAVTPSAPDTLPRSARSK